MDRKTFILQTLYHMPFNQLDATTGLNIRPQSNPLRVGILIEVRDAVRDAYEDDRIDSAHPLSRTHEISQNLRSEHALDDFLLITAARKLTVGDAALTVNPRTSIEDLNAQAVQIVYSQAVRRLVQHLEGEAGKAEFSDEIQP